MSVVRANRRCRPAAALNRYRWNALKTRMHPSVVVLGLVMSVGCGGDPQPTANTHGSSADTQYASAEGLLERYNAVTMKGSAVDPEQVMDLVFAETDSQTRLLKLLRGMDAMTAYRQALWEQFDAVRQDQVIAPLAVTMEPAQIEEHSGDRAVATQLDVDGTTITLHLVRIDERWWISAYTFEYDPVLAETIEQLDTADSMETFYLAAIVAGPRVTVEVRRGVYKSSAEADQALRRAFVDEGITGP